MDTLRIGLTSVAAGLLCVAMGPARPLAQSPLGGDIPPVAVDFTVADGRGQPILDLDAAEVVLRINGQVRPIASFERAGVGVASGGSLDLAPPYGTNVVRRTRPFVIVVDDESIRPGREQPTVLAISAMLTTLPAQTVVALATPRAGWRTPLTSDPEPVRRALDLIRGQATGQDDPECRTRMTLAALQGLLVPFTPNGAPAVFIVSGGLAGPRRDIPLGSRGLGRGAVVPSGCDLRIEDFLKVGEVFTAARAEVLVVQPEDVALVSVSQVSTPVTVNLTDGLLTLAGAAGGELEHLTAMENPFLGARRALLPFYVATFVPRAAERNSLPQRVEVHVTRDGVPMTVRTRGQIVIPRTLPSRPPATPAADLAALVRQLEVVRDLPIRVTAFATRNQSSATLMDVVAMTEALDGSRHLQTARAALFNRSGAIVTEWSSSGPVPAGPFFASLTVPAGTYRLRVAGVDAAGAGGSADYFVAAELTGAGALRLGGLVVGSIETGSFVPLFEVSRERRPMASMEIYGECRTDVRAVLEVAATDNGPALATTPLVIAATSEPDRCVASAELPIGTLSSGDFSLRAVVNLPGQPAGRVVRTLRKR